MYKRLLLILLYFVQANYSQGLVEEAANEVAKLREEVVGAILKAHTNLDDLYIDLQSYQINIETATTLSLQNVRQNIDLEIDTIVELATSQGIDVTYCLSRLENYFDYVLTLALEQLHDCISSESNEGAVILNDVKYLVDVTFNVVYQLEFQLGLCGDSEACVSPLLVRIEEEREKVPQDIEVEVMRATELFDQVKVLIQGCANLKLAQYIELGDSTLRDFERCLGLLYLKKA